MFTTRHPRRRAVWLTTLGLSVLVATSAAAAATETTHSRDALRDLAATADGTDGATGSAHAAVGADRTTVVLNLRDLSDAAGVVRGAHVHIGPCVANNGAAALGHFNAGGGISDQTEVWLDFEVRNSGNAHATAVVPFTIPDGAARSILIHAAPTDPVTGAAGARLACLPLEL
jgi:Cu-Zn family superoxide dismutase